MNPQLECLAPVGRSCDVCLHERWLQKFKSTQTSILSLERPARAIVVRPSTRQGLGNRHIGIHTALFVAVLTERLLVIEYPASQRGELDFLVPSIVRWDASEFPSEVRKNISWPGRTFRWRSLAKTFNYPVLLLRDADTHMMNCLRSDPTWQGQLQKRGLDWSSARHLEGCIPHALFQATPTIKAAFAVPLDSSSRSTAPRWLYSVGIHARVDQATNSERSYGWGTNAIINHTQRVGWQQPIKNMAACAASHEDALSRQADNQGTTTPRWYVACTDQHVVDLLNDTARHLGRHIISLPVGAVRDHSGLSRSVTNEASRVALLDILHLASAEFIVGTDGSSFTDLAVLTGALHMRSAITVLMKFARSMSAHGVGVRKLPPGMQDCGALQPALFDATHKHADQMKSHFCRRYYI